MSVSYTHLFFIHCLNEAYLSVNGLYSNILTVLSLAELGFGSAIVYHMYEPMATHNYQKVVGLLQFFKKVYFAVGIAIVALGLCVIPFMDVIIKDKPDVPVSYTHLLMRISMERSSAKAFLTDYPRPPFPATTRRAGPVTKS